MPYLIYIFVNVDIILYTFFCFIMTIFHLFLKYTLSFIFCHILSKFYSSFLLFFIILSM